MLHQDSTALISLSLGAADPAAEKPSDMHGILRTGMGSWEISGRLRVSPENGLKYLELRTENQAEGKAFVGRLFRDQSWKGQPRYQGFLQPDTGAPAGTVDTDPEWQLEISADFVGEKGRAPELPVIIGRAFPIARAGELSYDMVLVEAKMPF